MPAAANPPAEAAARRNIQQANAEILRGHVVQREEGARHVGVF
jgi:hypothetical protein